MDDTTSDSVFQLRNKLIIAEHQLQDCEYRKSILQKNLKEVTKNLKSDAEFEKKDVIGSIVYKYLIGNGYVFDIGHYKPFQHRHWFSRWYTMIASKKPSFGENNDYLTFVGSGGNENIFKFLKEENDPKKNFDENEKMKILYMINYPYYSYNYKFSFEAFSNNNNKKLTNLKKIKEENASKNRYEFIDIYMKRCINDEPRLQFACYAYLSFLKYYDNNDLSKNEVIQIDHQLKKFSDDCRKDYDIIMKSFCKDIVKKHNFGYNHFIGNCPDTGGKKIRRNRKSKKVKKSRKKRKSRRKSYNRRGRH